MPAEPNPGLLIYGTVGPAVPIATSFGGLCILPPFWRASSTLSFPLIQVGGCALTSIYWFDFGSYVKASAGLNSILPGNILYIQAWHRDPPNPGSANLTDMVGPFGPLLP